MKQLIHAMIHFYLVPLKANSESSIKSIRSINFRYAKFLCCQVLNCERTYKLSPRRVDLKWLQNCERYRYRTERAVPEEPTDVNPASVL